MSNLTCFDSSKSLLNTAFLLSHFCPFIDILSVKNNQFSTLPGVFKTSFYNASIFSNLLESNKLKFEDKSSINVLVLIDPSTSNK